MHESWCMKNEAWESVRLTNIYGLARACKQTQKRMQVLLVFTKTPRHWTIKKKRLRRKMNINVTGPALVAQFEGGVKREKSVGVVVRVGIGVDGNGGSVA